LISVDLIRYLAHIRAQMTLFYLKIWLMRYTRIC
jgi:hypothetical protein